MSSVTYRRSRKPGCLTVFLLLAVITLLGLWLNERHTSDSWPAVRISPRESRNFGEDEFPQLTEIWSEGSGHNKVVRIPVYGMILLRPDNAIFSASSSTDLALRAIRRATIDRDVLALILDIDSGGGGITASDILYNELMRFKQADPRRRIVAICGDVATSGAYYIALAADHIIARPTSITGSLGVMIQTINFREFANRHGIRDVTVKSGDNKDLLNPLSEISPAQLEIIGTVVNDMHQRFMDLIAERRKLPSDTVASLADGRIFTAAQALDHKLIDDIGYWHDAVNAVQSILNVTDVIIFRYEAAFSWRQLLRASTQLSPRAWLDATTTPQLQYRWRID